MLAMFFIPGVHYPYVGMAVDLTDVTLADNKNSNLRQCGNVTVVQHVAL